MDQKFQDWTKWREFRQPPSQIVGVQVQGLEIPERKDFSWNLPIKEVIVKTQILKVGAEAYLMGDPAGERIGAGVEVKKAVGPEKASWEGPSEEIVVEEEGLEGRAVAEVGWDGS